MKNFKTFNQLFLLLPFVLFLGQCNNEKNCDQENDMFMNNFIEQQKVHKITLKCKSFPTKNNFNTECSFGQDTSKIPNEKYEIEAAIGDIVIWDGEFSRPSVGYKINITEIQCDRPYIFGERNITDGGSGDECGKDGDIIAKVKQGKEGEVMKYKLLFEAVTTAGDTTELFTIDPKIRIILRRPSAVANDSLSKGN